MQPFAVPDEDFQRYFMNFHIALESFKRGELPQGNVIDVLLDGRSQNLASNVYAQVTERGLVDLEHLLKGVLATVAKGGSRDNVIIEKDSRTIRFEAISYERSNTTNVLYVTAPTAKDFNSFWRKSIENVALQSETGHWDYQRFRVITEHPDARKFRGQRDYANLRAEEKRKYDAELKRQKFRGKKYRDLSDTERAEFHAIFKADYWGLSAPEQIEYRDKFQDKGRTIRRNVARQIANAPGFDTIPINPHCMEIGGIEYRVQRQVVVDSDGESILEFEYLMQTFARTNQSAFNSILESAYTPKHGKRMPNEYRATYVDLNGKPSTLVNIGEGLFVNFHNHTPSSPITIDKLIAKITDYYHTALPAFGHVEDKDERENRVMEAVKLGMEDIPLGFFIYAQTTRTDLEGKYVDAAFDGLKLGKTLIKDRLGKKAEKGTRDHPPQGFGYCQEKIHP